ncbi:TPA: coniferyl aldehyde dehydrogenase [Pseudomonas aeruginosa]|uniref:coniferyl aldehyde dehydrogenase n=1 Tax=Pseudomonas aeruginosa TaxID=287 RepID=UPI003726F7A6
MTAIVSMDAGVADELRQTLELQRQAFLSELPVSHAQRVDRLRRLIRLLQENCDALCDAMSQDFGQRSRHVSQLTDIVYSLRNARHAIRRLKRWSRPSRRSLDFPLRLLGGDAWVEYQPKGVVGILSPWNFPVYLTLGPLVGVLAAGNRAMIKPSELTPATSALLAELVGRYFDRSEVAVFIGGIEVGSAFSALPFDHLVFTGGGSVGRHVMHAAADNLVPVTLELGGKSPVVVSASADIERAAERIVLGKLLNAGQICLAPDYVLVQRGIEERLVRALLDKAATIFPHYAGNPDYTAIIDARHFARLQGYLDDAAGRGAEVLHAGGVESDATSRILPFQLVRNPPVDSAIMRNEIFGPLLPVLGYDDLDDAIAFINRRDRPLGLYYFGEEASEERRLLECTIAGGVTLNDVVFHVMQEELPLGGVGASGIGRYHGREGFLEFSHAKAVYRQPRFDIAGLLGAKPPYGARLERYIRKELK